MNTCFNITIVFKSVFICARVAGFIRCWLKYRRINPRRRSVKNLYIQIDVAHIAAKIRDSIDDGIKKITIWKLSSVATISF